MWCVSKLSGYVLRYLQTSELQANKDIISIIKSINELNWNRAKTIWLFNVCKRKIDFNAKSMCTFGSEYDFFYKPISFMQRFQMFEKCLKCNKEKSPKEQNYLFFTENNGNLLLNKHAQKFCTSCGNDIQIDFNFVLGFPCWLICEIEPELTIYIDNLPKIIPIKDKNYKLLAATYHNGFNHFLGIFFLNNNFHVVNDKHPGTVQTTIPKKKITTCFYYLE